MIDLAIAEADGLPARHKVFSVPGPRHNAPVDGSDTTHSIRLVPLADLDLATEVEARTELERACDGPGAYRCVVVVSVPGWFVDIRGLAVLLDSADLARRHGRDLIVVRPPESLRQAVDALDLGDRLKFVNDLGDLD